MKKRLTIHRKMQYLSSDIYVAFEERMKTTIAQRIREARSFKQLDQGTLAAKIDIATRTVQRWEKGEQVPDSNYLMRIAKATGVLSHWLLTGEGEMIPSDLHKSKIIPLPTSRYKKVTLVSLPLFASVPGGAPSHIFHPEQAERHITVDDVRDPEAFALEVKGNSMSPRIENGDIIVVSPTHEVKSGDICVDEEDTVKRIKIDEQFVHLIPLNPEYEPMLVRKRDVTFMWRVIKVIKSV
jgi:repressor LexA